MAVDTSGASSLAPTVERLEVKPSDTAISVQHRSLQAGSLAVAFLALIASATSSWTTVMTFRRAETQDVQDELRRKADQARLVEEQHRSEQERRIAKRQELRALLQRLSVIPREVALDEFELNGRGADPRAAIQATYAASGAHNTENTILSKQAYDLIKSIQDDVSASECLGAAMALVNSYLFEPASDLLALAIAKAEKSKDSIDLISGLRIRGALQMQMSDSAGARRDFGDALGVFARAGFASSNKLFVDYTQYTTYMNWTGSELQQRNCSEARAAWLKADDLWSKAIGPMVGNNSRPLHATMKPALDSCR